MKTIGETELWSFRDAAATAVRSTNGAIRKDPGHLVGSYLDLATKVAELNFRNRDHILLFRGQADDYRNQKGNTTIKPSLFRSRVGERKSPDPRFLRGRFDLLLRAERGLLQHYAGNGFLGRERLRRHRILRWAILQHYEVCRTPLLDVTQSLRIAASFASLGATGESFVCVLAVPNISGAITASAEASVQVVRLASVCPPIAARPHLQEGYLLGEYPELVDYEQQERYGPYEIDFARRLVAKFRFSAATFWSQNTFPRVAANALYPKSDPLNELAGKIRAEVGDCE